MRDGASSITGGVNRTTTSASPPPAATAATVAVEATAEDATTLIDAPPLQAELSGMGPLPFTWYEGSVADLNIFGEEPLEIDEVASAPDVSQNLRNIFWQMCSSFDSTRMTISKLLLHICSRSASTPDSLALGVALLTSTWRLLQYWPGKSAAAL